MASNQFKVTLVGDRYVGKTRLLQNQCKEDGNNPVPTLGVNFRSLHMKSSRATIHVWDTSEQQMKPLIQIYIRCISGCIVVFDLKNDSSLTNVLETWLPLIKQHADDLYQVTVVGMKCDLKKQRQVSRERPMILMDELELKYYEASGVTGHNVEHIFTDLVERIIDMKETEAKKDRKLSQE